VQSEMPKTASAKEMAQILGISKSALDKMRCVSPENSPPFFKMGRRVIYPLTGQNSYAAWIAERVQGGRAAHD